MSFCLIIIIVILIKWLSDFRKKKKKDISFPWRGDQFNDQMKAQKENPIRWITILMDYDYERK